MIDYYSNGRSGVGVEPRHRAAVPKGSTELASRYLKLFAAMVMPFVAVVKISRRAAGQRANARAFAATG